MTLYAALDLHSNNNYLVVIDERDQLVFRRKQANELGPLLKVLEPFRPQLTGIVVESTYNWYWLVDGLMEAGWKVHLAHPAGNEQYSGIKYTNDWSDAQWLAHLLRLGLKLLGSHLHNPFSYWVRTATPPYESHVGRSPKSAKLDVEP